MTQQTPQAGDIVRVTYAAVWAPEDGDPRMVLTGNGDGDRWHNIVPEGAEIEVVLPAGALPEDKSPSLCQQNRRGDQRVPQPHFYQPGEDGHRCVFCSTPTHWGGEPARAYRTPDGRVWTKASETTEDGVPLYEAPFVGTRYTALALEKLHGDIEPVDQAEAPPYVLNSRSVNQSPATAVKHIPDADGRTICPGQFQGTKPLPQEQAAEYALCNGCRKALLARYEAAEHADA
ncbi:hypothetical protein ABZ923_38685 [Streptomyces sp. NPDC046881]|uniref:hypothetical protein n=1 Tax=Streptomyces sp. NPDC046881 TaxID=3155374 RepID=UPI0033C15F93